MQFDGPQTLEEQIIEFNEQPDASFKIPAKLIDVWALKAGSDRKTLIGYMSKKTGRDYEETKDAQPINFDGDLVEFPVVIFSVKGDQ